MHVTPITKKSSIIFNTWRSLRSMRGPSRRRARSFSIPDDLCYPCEAHHEEPFPLPVPDDLCYLCETHHEEEFDLFHYLTISAIHVRPITKKSSMTTKNLCLVCRLILKYIATVVKSSKTHFHFKNKIVI